MLALRLRLFFLALRRLPLLLICLGVGIGERPHAQFSVIPKDLLTALPKSLFPFWDRRHVRLRLVQLALLLGLRLRLHLLQLALLLGLRLRLLQLALLLGLRVGFRGVLFFFCVCTLPLAVDGIFLFLDASRGVLLFLLS